MILKRIQVDAGLEYNTNCYIIQDEKTKETMVIDPGADVNKIMEMLTTLNSKVKYILLTHCHADHIGGAEEIKEKTGANVLIHRYDAEGLFNSEISLTEHIGMDEIILEADSRVDDNDLIHVGNLEFKVIHTPGHTKGSICVYLEKENLLFSGDTIFRGSWGRTDLPTGNFSEIIDSITYKIMKLSGDTIIYPGHRKVYNDKRRITNIFRIKTKIILKGDKKWQKLYQELYQDLWNYFQISKFYLIKWKRQ